MCACSSEMTRRDSKPLSPAGGARSLAASARSRSHPRATAPSQRAAAELSSPPSHRAPGSPERGHHQLLLKEATYESGRPGGARPRAARDRAPARRADPRAGASRHVRPRPAAATGRAGRRQDPHPDPPRRLPALERPSEAMGDPRGHVQRSRRRRTTPTARRPARRDDRPGRHRGDVPLGVRAAVARARERVRPD